MALELVTAEPAGPAKPQPLLFVHGAWHGAWCWQEHYLPFFAANGYRGHALSLRGHGNSSGGRLRFTSIDHYVADVAEVVARLDAPPVIIGHSMGGLVVQKYLETVSLPGAALLATVPVGGVWRATLRVARRHPVRFLKANLTMSLWPLVSTPALAREMFFTNEAADVDVAQYQARMQDESYRAYLQMMLFRLPRPQRVHTPMMVMGAAADVLFSVEEQEATAAAYGAHLTITPDLAHDVMLDANWLAGAEAVLGWLDRKEI